MLGNLVSKIVGGVANGLTNNINNLANKLVVGYKFYVFIGPVSLAFNRVSGIEKTYDYEPLQEGGVNNKLFFLRKPMAQPSTIVFEDGGMTISSVNMKLYFSGDPKELLVFLCTADGSITNVVAIHNAVISKVNISQLDANKSDLVVNNIEMSYSGFSRISL